MNRTKMAVLTALALGACTTAPAEPRLRGLEKYADDPRLGPEKNSICFASTIDGFSMNDRETVLLHEGRDRYMVEVTAGCMDLDYAESIAIDSNGGCLTPGDSIIVARTLGDSFGSNRCMIREIREWNPKAEKPEAKAEENPA
jgi:Family of unknown function (DUF6491)